MSIPQAGRRLQRQIFPWMKAQGLKPLSSCEAELVALSEATKDVVYSRKFVTGLDKSAIRGPTDLRTDNTAGLLA